MIVDVMIVHHDGSYEIVKRDVPDDYHSDKEEKHKHSKQTFTKDNKL